MTTSTKTEFRENFVVRKSGSLALPVSVLALIVGFTAASTVRAAVDIAVTAITWTPVYSGSNGVLASGENIKFSATIENLGTTTSGTVSVQFKVDGTTVQTINQSALAPGAWAKVDATASWTTTNGTHAVSAALYNFADSNSGNDSLITPLVVGIATSASALPFNPLAYSAYSDSSQYPRKVVVHHHNYTVKGSGEAASYNVDGGNPADFWNRVMEDATTLIQNIPCDGGAVRARPYPVAALDATSVPNSDGYLVDRWRGEMQAYKDAAVDYVFVNIQPISGTGGTRRERMIEALAAASRVGGIKILMNIDWAGNTNPSASITPAAAAAWACGTGGPFSSTYAGHYAWVNGRKGLGAFIPPDDGNNNVRAQWYKDFMHECAGLGVYVAFIPSIVGGTGAIDTFYNLLTTGTNALNANSLPGYGSFGAEHTDTDYTTVATTAYDNRSNRFFIWPVRPEDYRISNNRYKWAETDGPFTFINNWARAIAFPTAKNPQWVQHITANDQAEGTSTWPTTGNNYFWMDLAAWFTHKYKTGSYPAIARECIMYCHRSQYDYRNTTYGRGSLDRDDAAHPPISPDTDYNTWTYPFNSPVVSDTATYTALTDITNIQSGTETLNWNTGVSRNGSLIYAVVFLKSAAVVKITFGGTTYTSPTLQAGMHVVYKAFTPGQSGQPVFMIDHSNGDPDITITSKYPIVSNPLWTNPEYYCGSSLRKGSYQ
ncbi:exported hypothetical protein [uncultured Defluviicoccus sp.]|uniref:CARDB domain-containing protein n=1 Tax=metagenome TaxID=256318 RepID=A0A380TEX0_9ZZZZ|nr:exported hypothetical protein [uncultured Defluviicoccus sp.]